jgi:hypothetical protein
MTSQLPLTAQPRRTASRSVHSLLRAGLACLAALAMVGCQSSFVSGKVVDGSSSLVIISDSKDQRFAGPGIEGAEAELRAVRDGLGDRLVSKTMAGPDGSFSIGVVDRLTSESLFLIVSKAGYITARGPVSIAADGKQALVVLKKTVR